MYKVNNNIVNSDLPFEAFIIALIAKCNKGSFTIESNNNIVNVEIDTSKEIISITEGIFNKLKFEKTDSYTYLIGETNSYYFEKIIDNKHHKSFYVYDGGINDDTFNDYNYAVDYTIDTAIFSRDSETVSIFDDTEEYQDYPLFSFTDKTKN